MCFMNTHVFRIKENCPKFVYTVCTYGSASVRKGHNNAEKFKFGKSEFWLKHIKYVLQ